MTGRGIKALWPIFGIATNSSPASHSASRQQSFEDGPRQRDISVGTTAPKPALALITFVPLLGS